MKPLDEIVVSIILIAGTVLITTSINKYSSSPPKVGAGISPPAPATKTYRVTAYCPCSKCCGIGSPGITASGKKAEGLIVAADSRMDFGTVLSIPGYGIASVEDRGSAIKGDRLDVLFTDKDGVTGHQRALNFGVQYLEVKVLDKSK